MRSLPRILGAGHKWIWSVKHVCPRVQDQADSGLLVVNQSHALTYLPVVGPDPLLRRRSGRWGALRSEVKEEPKVGDTRGAECPAGMIPRQHSQGADRSDTTEARHASRSMGVTHISASKPMNAASPHPSFRGACAFPSGRLPRMIMPSTSSSLTSLVL
jgi:hypothetical protein